jgi:hypothetical protein
MKTTYIADDAIPVTGSIRGRHGGVARAGALLQGARDSNKTLVLTLDDQDRGGTWLYRIRQAARLLKLQVEIRCEYATMPHRVKPEARVIYVTIITPHVVTPNGRLPIQAPPDRRYVNEVGAEVSR